MELGTKDFPFRTIFPAFAEIMEVFSNSNSEITIYIKENTTVYIEDSSVFLIDIGLLIIDTYSDFETSGPIATIVTKDSSIIKMSEKSAFNIVRNTTIDINAKISEGTLSEKELGVAGREGDTLQLVRSSLTIKNIIVRREASNTHSGLFIDAIYLQDK